MSQNLERLARSAARAALDVAGARQLNRDLSISFTSDTAIARLNRIWRARNGPTNVLSFPVPHQQRRRFLGDVVLGSGVVRREALAQGKKLSSHAAHLVIHGVLHLLGYDHEEASAARKMERMEIRALKSLGIANPYHYN